MKSKILEVLFPKVRAELVRALFFSPARQMYVRELARHCNLALSTVQQELATLRGAGLIVSRSNGYHRFYRANLSHSMFADLQQLVIKGGRIDARAKRSRRHRT